MHARKEETRSGSDKEDDDDYHGEKEMEEEEDKNIANKCEPRIHGSISLRRRTRAPKGPTGAC